MLRETICHDYRAAAECLNAFKWTLWAHCQGFYNALEEVFKPQPNLSYFEGLSMIDQQNMYNIKSFFMAAYVELLICRSTFTVIYLFKACLSLVCKAGDWKLYNFVLLRHCSSSVRLNSHISSLTSDFLSLIETNHDSTAGFCQQPL